MSDKQWSYDKFCSRDMLSRIHADKISDSLKLPFSNRFAVEFIQCIEPLGDM